MEFGAHIKCKVGDGRKSLGDPSMDPDDILEGCVGGWGVLSYHFLNLIVFHLS